MLRKAPETTRIRYMRQLCAYGGTSGPVSIRNDLLSIGSATDRHPAAYAIVVTQSKDRIPLVLHVSDGLGYKIGHERRMDELLAFSFVTALVVRYLTGFVAVTY